jgi:hypothetical protein
LDTSANKVDFKKLEVWWIGNNESYMLNDVLNRLQPLEAVRIQRLEIQSLYSNKSLQSTDFKESSLVIFDGNWISDHFKDLDVHMLLRDASYKGAKLVAIGGLTSKFFEALDEAEVNVLSRDENGNIRNPAHFDPPLVGFKFKEAVTPSGYKYSYPSIFASNTKDLDGMFQVLINWLGE